MRPSVGTGVFVFASTVVLAGMIAASGCTVLTNDSLPDDAGKFEGGDATTQTCPTCLGQECTGQWAACLTDPACTALAKRASSSTCEADGGAADGGVDPLALYGAFSACGAAKAGAGGVCASDCTGSSQPAPCASDAGVDSGSSDSGSSDAGSSDAGDAGADAATNDAGDAGDAGIADAGGDADGGTPTTPSVDGCSSCVSGKCGDAKKACAIASECAAYLECTYAAVFSSEPAAADECGRQHATGKTAAVELATCTRVGCSNECGF